MRLALFFFSIVFFFSCETIDSQVITNIDAEQFFKKINENNGIIIDVRTPEEFHSGHINEATNINFYDEDFIDKLQIVRKDLPIYIYCRSGGRSSLAATKMEELGFAKVYNLSRGIDAWYSDGYQSITTHVVEKIIPPKFSDLEVDNFLDSNDVVLLVFSTEWCVPCKKMIPIIQEIKQENINIEVLFLDADENKQLMKSYEIQAVPGFIVFKFSNEVFRHTGVISKEELVVKLN
tara:strand:- start:106 stop:810 length:705 start_codon:yes stop_codon:yes gene_type:complete